MIISGKSETVTPSIKSAYQKAHHDLRFRYSKIGCCLALVLIPTGILLDYFVYQFFVEGFLKIRVLAVTSLGGILLIHYTKPGKRYVRILDTSWMLVVTTSIGMIIALSEGPNSPYYAGLNLVILAAAVLLPWTLKETLFLCLFTLLTYFGACVFHTVRTGLLTNWNILFNNTYFIIFTAIICCTSSYYASRARFQDFVLRHELDIRNKRLEELDRLKSQFFANVSHELRTPLTSILSPIESILHEHKGLSRKVHKGLLLAHKNTLRLLKLVNEILDTVQIDAGKLKLSKKPVNLGKFILGILESVHHLTQQKNLKLETEIPSETAIIEGDPGRLEKVFLNLLSNAIKFTPSGGTITVRLQRTEDNVIVEVEDTGDGIDSEELSHIFDRFYQADGSPTRSKRQGVGIGLALTRDLVEQHNGKVTAQSAVGHGTTFKIELPRLARPEQRLVVSSLEEEEENPIASAVELADRTLIANVQSQAQPLPPIGKGDTTILVVDDEPDILHFIASNIADDYRVLRAVSGEQAVAIARSEKPEAILLDWMLPGMDGLKVCETLRADEAMQTVKILLLTARVDEESKIKVLKRGADDFLTKPFSVVEVKTRLANLLRTAKLQRDLHERNTHLERTLRQLKKTESQLVQSEKMRALGILSAGLLHEINNPLNFTLTALKVCQQSTKNERELQDTLNDIEEGMQRIREIISDLHTFAYPQRAEEQATFDLNSTLDSALRLIAHEIVSIHIIRDIRKNPQIIGSKTQIAHVLINLIMNSVKALKETPKNTPPSIKISGQVHKGRLHVSVWDNGIGIKPEVMDHIFDPFFTTRDVGEGIGLGLSICHTIIKNHGGTLSVKSKYGESTKLDFDLPLALAKKPLWLKKNKK